MVSPPEPPPTHIDSLLVEKEGYGGFPAGAPITLFAEYLLLFFNKIEPPLPPFPLSPLPSLFPERHDGGVAFRPRVAPWGVRDVGEADELGAWDTGEREEH